MIKYPILENGVYTFKYYLELKLNLWLYQLGSYFIAIHMAITTLLKILMMTFKYLLWTYFPKVKTNALNYNLDTICVNKIMYISWNFKENNEEKIFKM